MMNKEFWKAAFNRAIRTVCQTAIAMISTATLMQELNWINVVSASLLAGIMSILTSVVSGLPEAPKTSTNSNENKE